MITIYDQRETSFTNNGLGVIKASSAVVTEELNGMYELEVKCPNIIENAGLMQYIKEFNLIRAPTPRGHQIFRIYRTIKLLTGEIAVNARHIYYDGLYNLVRSASGQGSVDLAIRTIYGGLAYSSRFNVSSTLSGYVDFEYTNTNPINAILSDEGIMGTLGKGEILRDNYNITVKESIGENRGFVVRYRKNLTGLNVETKIDNMATRILPIARDEEGEPLYLPETFVNSPYVNDYFMPIFAPLEFSDIRLGDDIYPDLPTVYAEMRRRASAFFETESDRPTVNAKIDFILLRNTAEYSEYASLENIFLGDTVNAVHDGLSFNMTSKCIKYTYDCIMERYKSLELGHFRGDFAASTGRDMGTLRTIGRNNSTTLEQLEARMNSHIHNSSDGTQRISYFDLANRPT